jgi:hypothetical protein
MSKKELSNDLGGGCFYTTLKIIFWIIVSPFIIKAM